MRHKRLFIFLIIGSILLLIPLIAMQFTQDVNWNTDDFIIAGMLLFSTIFVCELVLRKIRSKKARIMLCIALFVCFGLIWAELAVGIFGTFLAGS